MMLSVGLFAVVTGLAVLVGGVMFLAFVMWITGGDQTSVSVLPDAIKVLVWLMTAVGLVLPVAGLSVALRGFADRSLRLYGAAMLVWVGTIALAFAVAEVR